MIIVICRCRWRCFYEIAKRLPVPLSLGFGLRLESARKRAIEEGYFTQMMDITFTDPAVQEKYLKARTYTNLRKGVLIRYSLSTSKKGSAYR